MASSDHQPLFPELRNAVEAEENIVTEIESYCVNCGENGLTRMLLTEIPFFKQVVVISFECPHCHFRNNELQPAQQIGPKGVRFELAVKEAKDLSRTIVKTEWAQVKIPEIEFEVKQQNGLITTVEGIIDRAITGLQYSYDRSKEEGNEEDEETTRGPLRQYIERMAALKELTSPFTLIIEDISGNSFVENYLAPEADPQLEETGFIRTIEDDKLLGIYQNEEEDGEEEEGDRKGGKKEKLKDEVLQFATNCPHCNAPCFTNMKMTAIPHFKEILIMATNCDVCGHKTNEIKSAAGFEETGVRITLEVKEEADLKKEVVRSDTCDITIPELALHLSSTGSGRYTTVQGLGLNMIDDLRTSNPFIDGDSSREDVKRKVDHLTTRLQNLVGCTILLDDPCGNSYLEGATKVERYTRSWEQNEELGINDMKTENYQGVNAAIEEEEEEPTEEEKKEDTETTKA